MEGCKQQDCQMTDTDHWLRDYGDMQAALQYPVLHHIAIVASVFGLVGLLWTLPVPAEFVAISPLLNWGTAFLMAAVVYYFIIATSLAIGMLPFVIALTSAAYWIETTALALELIAACALLSGVAGLFVSRTGSGRVAALMREIQLLMIGPVWLLSRLYRRLGIPF
jgi:hypothetical protein